MAETATGILEQAEYVEQAYLFQSLNSRIAGQQPIQELLAVLRHEILSTTNLPKAIDFILAELNHAGRMSDAMARLPHYFTAFQTFLIHSAEAETGKFDIRTAMQILEHDSRFRSQGAEAIAMFMFQFETLCRHRLEYDHGLSAMSLDPVFTKDWATWLLDVRHKIGIVDMADLIYVHSEHYIQNANRSGLSPSQYPKMVLFGEKEGRIALANRGREPLLLFGALQRQLGYPVVPRFERVEDNSELLEKLQRIVGRMEIRMKLLEDEQRERGIDLSQFYQRPENPS